MTYQFIIKTSIFILGKLYFIFIFYNNFYVRRALRLIVKFSCAENQSFVQKSIFHNVLKIGTEEIGM